MVGSCETGGLLAWGCGACTGAMVVGLSTPVVDALGVLVAGWKGLVVVVVSVV